MKNKTKIKIKHITRSENMLTVRVPNRLLISCTKIAKNVGMTRSNYVRTILQKEDDTSNLL